MKPTMRKLRMVARKLGATVEKQTAGAWVHVRVDAPEGYLWSCAGDVHCLAVIWRNDESDYEAEAIQDAIERMSHGVTPCDDSECETCRPA